MKHAILAAILAALTIGTTSTVRADDPVGRYQLVPATVEFISSNDPTTQDRVLFRINTAPGQAWVYQPGMIKGKLVQEWIAINE
jgi:hypothetical protein